MLSTSEVGLILALIAPSPLETVKNVLKIVLIIVNINKDENKSLILNQFSLKNDSPPLLGELFCAGKIKPCKMSVDRGVVELSDNGNSG
jgi:hypothetical protein